MLLSLYITALLPLFVSWEIYGGMLTHATQAGRMHLTPLSSYGIHEGRAMIGATPVCISMEPVSMNIEDLIWDIDFSTTKKHRSVVV